jgi:hypothetical protein
MAFVDYALVGFGNRQLVKESTVFWSYRMNKSQPQKQSLEDQIHQLRMKMEQLFLQGFPLTSDSVIEASSILDLKLNEYMTLSRDR